MSQENVEIVRQGYEAFNRGDLDQVLDQMSQDLVTYRGAGFGDTFHGRQGYLKVTAEWTENFSEWSVAPKEFIDAGDHVVVRVAQEARGEQSGARVSGEFWFVHTLAQGKIIRFGMFASKREALEAAGLLE